MFTISQRAAKPWWFVKREGVVVYRTNDYLKARAYRDAMNDMKKEGLL